MQMFVEGHDGATVDRFSFTDRRIGAALERAYVCAGSIKTFLVIKLSGGKI